MRRSHSVIRQAYHPPGPDGSYQCRLCSLATPDHDLQRHLRSHGLVPNPGGAVHPKLPPIPTADTSPQRVLVVRITAGEAHMRHLRGGIAWLIHRMATKGILAEATYDAPQPLPNPTNPPAMEDGLTPHEAITLRALRRALQTHPLLTTRMAYHAYVNECRLDDRTPRQHTQFWNYLQHLKQRGLIRAERSGKGYQGTTTLIRLPTPEVVA